MSKSALYEFQQCEQRSRFSQHDLPSMGVLLIASGEPGTRRDAARATLVEKYGEKQASSWFAGMDNTTEMWAGVSEADAERWAGVVIQSGYEAPALIKPVEEVKTYTAVVTEPLIGLRPGFCFGVPPRSGANEAE